MDSTVFARAMQVRQASCSRVYFFFDRVIYQPLFDIIGYHGRGQNDTGKTPVLPIYILDRLVQIQPHRGDVVVPGQGKPGGTSRDAAFRLLFHGASIPHFGRKVNRKLKACKGFLKMG